MGTELKDGLNNPAVKQEYSKIKEDTNNNLENKNKIILNHYHETVNNSGSLEAKTRCIISADRLNHLRKKVEHAINERKTFTIKGGYHSIRNALLQRGWIEKIEIRVPSPKCIVPCSNPPSMEEVCSNLPPKQEWESNAAHIAKCEKMIISRLLQNHEVDFYWNLRKDNNEWQHRLNRNKIINRFSRSLFTSKEGLCLLLQQLYWHNEPGVSFVRFPRCYTINFADQCTAFIEDFRITACISLLKHFITKIQFDGEFSISSDKGKVPLAAVQFAIDRCNEYINVQKHMDIDREFHKTWDHEWEQFLTNFQLIVHKNELYEENPRFNLYNLENLAKNTLKNIIPFWPQFELDGIKNVWIMKPGNKCRGRDIKLIKDANDVLRVMNNKMKYVVQKYIERPLLIYKTKFDIRQWFLITCVQPLTIWMYRDCYLRFSSKTFSLDNFHESVHLTNHAVQHKYTNADRDKALPDDNMWDNHTFKTYLRQIGQAEKWYKIIYPGMRESIIGAMLASQETMDRRPNTFELYGADFMIAENFTPWLIEINSCPAMGPTTSVTARMCPQCFEDILKVVIDRRKDPKADTGLFELVYRQNLPQSPAYLGMTLSIRGRKLFKKRSASKPGSIKDNKENPSATKSKTISVAKLKMDPKLIKNYKGPIIGNLIEELHESIFKKPSDIEEMLSAEPELVANSKIIQEKRSKSPFNQDNVFHYLKQKSNKKTSSVNSKQSKKEGSSRKMPKSVPQSSNNVMREKIKNYNNKTWEQGTASILKNNICLTNPPVITTNPEYTKLKNLYHNADILKNDSVVPLNKFLPGFNHKPVNTQIFTVGLGYKNNNYIKENLLLLTKPTVANNNNNNNLKLNC